MPRRTTGFAGTCGATDRRRSGRIVGAEVIKHVAHYGQNEPERNIPTESDSLQPLAAPGSHVPGRRARERGEGVQPGQRGVEAAFGPCQALDSGSRPGSVPARKHDIVRELVQRLAVGAGSRSISAFVHSTMTTTPTAGRQVELLKSRAETSSARSRRLFHRPSKPSGGRGISEPDSTA